MTTPFQPTIMHESFQPHVVLDAQAAGVPVDVKEDIRKLWIDQALGNDYYYYSWNYEYNFEYEYAEGEEIEEPADEDDDWRLDKRYPALAKFIEDNGDPENLLIRFWW